MITDEQFEACRLAANESYKRHKGSIRGQIITPEDDWEWHFARELIALAQQIKPLVWTDLKYATGKKAETCFGNYYVSKIDALPYWTVYLGEDEFDYADTEAEAIEAANADYRKRVLSCLVWGVV